MTHEEKGADGEDCDLKGRHDLLTLFCHVCLVKLDLARPGSDNFAKPFAVPLARAAETKVALVLVELASQ